MDMETRPEHQADAVAPTVSIGMPAYNAQATIRESIDALLRQTLVDFELIISDNASTDGTWAIIEDCARRDTRIVAMRQPVNVGANGNYSAVFRAARARYFKWASSNDWCAPEFLALCVAHLEAHPDTVMVSPRTKLFETSLDSAIEYDRDAAFDSENAVDRLFELGRSLALNNVLNGVIRSDALRATRLIEHYPGADVVLVGHLALLGKVSLLEPHLFYRRMDQATATRLMSREAVHRHHYPAKTWRSLFPAWRMTAGWLQAVLSSHLSARETRRALGWVLRHAYWSKSDLRRDLIDAINYPVRR